LANSRWHEFTGIAEGEIATETWLATYHPEDVDKVQKKWTEMLAQGVAGEIEARMRRADGAMRNFLVRATPMHEADGQIVRWYGTNIDIDEIKRLEEAQQNLARTARLTTMGELTVSIAHEVNQPLMAIVTNAATCLQWLSDGHVNIPSARQAAERIVADGHRAGDIVTSIRALARKAAPIIASSASDRTVERGSVGPVFMSSTVVRFRHFATVLGLMPSSRLNCESEACDRCIAALTACVVVALP
jgi:PAS domain S-box-containing protein